MESLPRRPAPALADAVKTRVTLPPQPYGHPDIVLSRAVALGYLARQDAALISLTYLDGHTLPTVAGRFGLTAQVLRARRNRAAHHLAAVIRAGHLSDVTVELDAARFSQTV